MALDFSASFGYSTTILSYFTSTTGNGSQAINATGGRTGLPSLRYTSDASDPTNNTRRNFYTVPSGATKWMGGAWKFPVLPTSDFTIMAWREGGSIQCDLRVTSLGKLRLTRNGTSLALSTNQVVFAATYFQLDAKLLVHLTTGTFDLRLSGDGAGVAGLTGLTGLVTRNTANATVDQISFDFVGGIAASTLIDLCHPFARDDNWSGDAHIDYFPSTGAGEYAQWTPLSGSNVSNIDETGSANTADWNASQTVGNKDSFTHAAILATSTPIAVCPVVLLNKQDAGLAQVKILLRQAATDFETGAIFNPPLGSNQYFKDVYMNDPVTGLPWTGAQVNSVEIGYDRTA